MLVIVDQLAVIASYTEEELPHRYHTLLAQLAVGYDFLNLYRREQDKQWADNRQTALFSQFYELVVAHHAKSREVKYYAELLGLSPKHFTKIIRSVTNGMSPADWIEQYVITQAKRIIEAHPNQQLNQAVYQLGFFDPTSFYRYFKHATGMTAKEYAKSLR
jgi:AraC-like DNA-binding protein